MRKHWFFDLDGTLARTGEDIIVAWKETLRQLGRPLGNFDAVFRIGPPLEKVVYDLYDDATPELVAAMTANFKPLYDDGGFPNTEPYDGVTELLAELKGKGCRIYIVTNKRHAPTQGIAKKFGWDKVFDGIWSYDSLEEKYKKPELLGILMKQVGAVPNDTVMVGDTSGDIEAGKANGAATIGVSWGYGELSELKGADVICDTPLDVARKMQL